MATLGHLRHCYRELCWESLIVLDLNIAEGNVPVTAQSRAWCLNVPLPRHLLYTCTLVYVVVVYFGYTTSLEDMQFADSLTKSFKIFQRDRHNWLSQSIILQLSQNPIGAIQPS